MRTARLTTHRAAGLATLPTRRIRVAVKASREVQLAEMEEMKLELRKQLDQAKLDSSSSSNGVPVVPAVPEAEVEGPPRKPLAEVTQDNFYDALEKAGSKLVVVDCYTDWCGPCKMILPTLEAWNHELEGHIEMVKFNCNKSNKDLGKALGIKVAPTFLLFKDSKEVARMTGAKADQLRQLIEEHQ